ncbi:hypothetical protein LEA_17063, partial [human gut metagenome]
MLMQKSLFKYNKKRRKPMFHIAQYFPITDPTLIFFVVLLIIL